jgi:hypothetical protein
MYIFKVVYLPKNAVLLSVISLHLHSGPLKTPRMGDFEWGNPSFPALAQRTSCFWP